MRCADLQRRRSPPPVAVPAGRPLRLASVRARTAPRAVSNPSWLAPDLVTHSCTMWWQAFMAAVDGVRASQRW